MINKKCTKCNLLLPLCEFSPRGKDNPHLRSACKKCNSKEWAEHKKNNTESYKKHREKAWRDKGINFTNEQYTLLFYAQQGKCACCGREQMELKYALAVDHNHTTGQVRGLLCSNCNHVIGLAHENSAILRAIADYLDKYNEE